MVSLLAMMALQLPGFSSLKIKFELQMVRFFHEIFQKEIASRSEVTASLNNNVLKAVKDAYSIKGFRNGFPNISFQSPEVRCAYLFQYAPCFASTVAYHYEKLVSQTPWMFEAVMLQDYVTICCLGGGPATEVVAIVKVLEEMIWAHCPRSGHPMRVHATVIDLDFGWKDSCQHVLASVGSLVDGSQIQLKLSFIKADLTKPLEDHVKKVIMKSDIVTMIKFLSAVRDEGSRNVVPEMLQEIVHCIKEGGTLFFLDSCGYQNYDLLRSATCPHDLLIQIYGSIHYDMYQMSHPSFSESNRLFSRYFDGRSCSQRSKNYVSAWYRFRQVDRRDSVHSYQWPNRWPKHVIY